MVTVHGIANGTSDGAANRKMNRLFNQSERKSPTNYQFERHVARLESRQQQQQQQQQQRRLILATLMPNYLGRLCEPESPAVIFLHYSFSEEPRNYPANQSRLLAERSTTSNSMSDSGFSEITSTKTRTDARHSTRRKSKKKCKKHRQHFRKPTDGSEITCVESNSSTPSVDMIDSCEGSTLSPKHVGDILFEETFSPSSSVKEGSEKAPDSENDNEYNGCSVASVSSASYCDETELSRPTTSCLELFGQFNSNNYRYLDNIPNSELMDSSQEPRHASRSGHCSGNTRTLLSSRNERGHSPCELAEFCSSSDGVDDTWLENSNCSSDFSSENGVGVCNGAQEAHLCSDGSRGSDFCLVVSRKRARKEKKMSMSKSFNGEHPSAWHGPNEKYASRSSRQVIKELNTKDYSHRQDHVDSIQPRHGVVLKRSIKNFIHKRSNEIPFKHSESGTSHNPSASPKENSNSKSYAESGTSHNHFTSPKQNSKSKSNGDFDKERNIDLNKRLSNGVHCRESTSCEMRSNSASEPTTLESAKENCTPESSQSADHVVGDFPILKRGLQGSLRVNYAIGTGSGLPSPDSKSSETDLLVGCGVIPFIAGNHSSGKFSSSEMHLIQMTKVVNEAYEVQDAADAHLSAGYPITDLEIFMQSATPVIGHVPCLKISNSSQDQSVRRSICQQYMSNIYLRNIWEWYEEPGCYGLEVRDLSDRSSTMPHRTNSEFCAYFVPYLSAIQLFGRSTKNMDNGFGVEEGDMFGASGTISLLSSQPVPAKLHKPFEQSNTFFSESSFFAHGHGELIFEYFETEQPSCRPPLFEKIKELSSLNLSGDSEKLQNVKLCDLHPASWYCVAWYPIYRVPHGNFRASFLTYHSLGKLVQQMPSTDLSGGQHTRIVCPVVGLQGYNDKGEQWFDLRCPDSSKPRCAEAVKERLRTLKQGALEMARAAVPRGSEKSSANHHPDFEFFLSRST